ncbi:MAG: hypothetical protein WA919_16665 [Coleofasciculaceae cyanobacterium]
MSISTALRKLSANFTHSKSATSNAAINLSASGAAATLSNTLSAGGQKDGKCREPQSWLYVTPEDFLL